MSDQSTFVDQVIRANQGHVPFFQGLEYSHSKPEHRSSHSHWLGSGITEHFQIMVELFPIMAESDPMLLQVGRDKMFSVSRSLPSKV